MNLTNISAPRDVAGQRVTGIAAEIARRDSDQAFASAQNVAQAAAALGTKEADALPIPSAAYRGSFHVLTKVGTADALYWCRQKADGTYEWVAL